MSFYDDVKAFSQRVLGLKDGIQTEEATKMSMVVPFFQLLGYDVFNPAEFCPEFTADVGLKKGEKVDYAIMLDGDPSILIECKWCGESLEKHNSQLYRYFGTTSAKFGILTNGIIYRFYTDLEESNKMDLSPFLEIDLSDLKENLVNELKKFSKESYDKDNIFSTASELKYSGLIKAYLKLLFDDPSDDYIRFILNEVYDGQKTQKVIEKFKPTVKKAGTSFINDIVNQKISSALVEEKTDEEPESDNTANKPDKKIVTTPDEIQAYYIIKGMLAGIVDLNKIAYRDTESYFGILFADNSRKPICRLKLDGKKMYLMIPDAKKDFSKIEFHSLNDLYAHRDAIITVVQRYITSNEK